MLPVLTGRFEEDELQYSFNKVDKYRTGHIDVNDFKAIVSKLSRHYTENEVGNVVGLVNYFHNGKLNYQGNASQFLFSYSFNLYIFLKPVFFCFN